MNNGKFSLGLKGGSSGNGSPQRWAPAFAKTTGKFDKEAARAALAGLAKHLEDEDKERYFDGTDSECFDRVWERFDSDGAGEIDSVEMTQLIIQVFHQGQANPGRTGDEDDEDRSDGD